MQEQAKRLIGREITMLPNAGGLPVGAKYKVVNAIAYGTSINITTATGQVYNIYPKQYKVSPVTTLELKEEKLEHEKAIKETNRKLAFIEETGTEAFDETEFKVYNILQELKESDSEIGKARAIAKLIS